MVDALKRFSFRQQPNEEHSLDALRLEWGVCGIPGACAAILAPAQRCLKGAAELRISEVSCRAALRIYPGTAQHSTRSGFCR